MNLTQKVKNKMDTEEFIKNYKYKKVYDRSKVKNRLVNERYRKSMNIITFHYNKRKEIVGTFNTFDEMGMMPTVDPIQENEDLFDLVYDIKRGYTGLEV
tara:strand:+ start:334 stop:630 length:297 start_codon:yes stop_codon:yes gene_type:complete